MSSAGEGDKPFKCGWYAHRFELTGTRQVALLHPKGFVTYADYRCRICGQTWSDEVPYSFTTQHWQGQALARAGRT